MFVASSPVGAANDGSFTVIVNERLAVFDRESVTLYVTLLLPVAEGVPLILRVSASKVRPEGNPVTEYWYAGAPPVALGSVVENAVPFLAVLLETDGSFSTATTLISNVRLSDFEAESVALYVTLDVPVLVGVPLTLRVDAVNDIPDGRPETVYVYGSSPPLAAGSTAERDSLTVPVRLLGVVSVKSSVPVHSLMDASGPATALCVVPFPTALTFRS